MEESKIKIEALISGDIEKVWDFWTKPEHIIHWNFASEDWHCPGAQNDLRPGGIYNARMEAKDGSIGFDFIAVYDEVIKNRKISYTMGDGRKAVTNFESQDDKTKVITSFDPESENPPEMQKNGWQAILNNFKKYVEADS